MTNVIPLCWIAPDRTGYKIRARYQDYDVTGYVDSFPQALRFGRKQVRAIVNRKKGRCWWL